MSYFIDKRQDSRYQHAINRQRFIRRFHEEIKSLVSKVIQGRKLSDVEKGEVLHLPLKTIQEPVFKHGSGGYLHSVLPGNQDYITGDKIVKPPSKEGSGSGPGANSSEETGWDDFRFYLSKEEFLNIFFDDLALPNLTKLALHALPMKEIARGGYSRTGIPPRLHLLRTFRQAMPRRLSTQRHLADRIKAIEIALVSLEKNTQSNPQKRIELLEELRQLKAKKIPFLDKIDLRYSQQHTVEKQGSQAVMFCIMDVSGSMDEIKKSLAKQFFILLYLFLTRHYHHIKIIFIRHHTLATEVNEEDFFYSQETGGTVVSSALELLDSLIRDRFSPKDWNIYVAQASDGDNWQNDSPLCQRLLAENIMPFVQYYAYIEILPRFHQSLWQSYLDIATRFPHFALKTIEQSQDIYPVFHDLFKRKLG